MGVRGEHDRRMHGLKQGDTLGMRGAFGTFFDTDAMQGRDLLLISGGCGLAPMRALIQLVEDLRNNFGRVSILYGAKSPNDMLYKDELKGGKVRDTQCQVRGTRSDGDVLGRQRRFDYKIDSTLKRCGENNRRYRRPADHV
jgi:NAD(P)H-flavin reductase